MLNGSQESIKTFDQSLRKLDKQFNILNLKFVKLFDTYESNNEIYTGVCESIQESVNNIKDVNKNQSEIKNYLRNINAGFAIYERNIQDLTTKLISNENRILLKQQGMKENEEALKDDITKLTYTIDEQGKSITDQLEVLFKYIDIYKEAIELTPHQTYELDEVEELTYD